VPDCDIILRMPSRQETARQKIKMLRDMREQCHDGRLSPGSFVPSQRELAERYQLSMPIVARVLGELIDEGVLYTVPRVGTFVGRPRRDDAPIFMLLFSCEPANSQHHAQVRSGFEERISQLGGRSLLLTQSQLARDDEPRQQPLNLPPLDGVFEFDIRGDAAPLLEAHHTLPDARVRFGGCAEDSPFNTVDFDHAGGGRLAVGHLRGFGHKSIAFLGLHARSDDDVFPWSAAREVGWREMMSAELSDAEVARLSFHPRVVGGIAHDKQIAAARQAARPLINAAQARRVSAVVAVNSLAAQGLLMALQESQMPVEHWPALVCFDDFVDSGGYVLSSLRLPWEEIGRVAAELLWERQRNPGGPAQRRLVPMRLISRLSCQPAWSLLPGVAALAGEPSRIG
jgi:DNA-binding LacI/PurR family transcriptional regulator